MNCFPCFSSQRSKKNISKREHAFDANQSDTKKPKAEGETEGGTAPAENVTSSAKTFTFRELASATKNFRQEFLIGEGGFGRVFKGKLQATDQVVAVKQLDRNGMEGNKDFVVEVSNLSRLQHENLVNLIGYCADGDQRLLVYEYMAGGSVADHLFDLKPEQKPLDWVTRMKISYGAAQGLEYLHEKVNPHVIYRDLKSSNILLDEEMNPKLGDFGLAKLDKTPASNMVMGSYGYCAPEYGASGQLTVKSDVYSFGVFLLEVITGRRAVDTTKPMDEQNLVAWAQPIFRDPKRYTDMADPLLLKQFPERGLNQAVAITSMCLQDEPSARPLISDVMTALSFLSMATEPIPPPSTDQPEDKKDEDAEDKSNNNNGDDKDDKDDSSTDNDEEEESAKNQGEEDDRDGSSSDSSDSESGHSESEDDRESENGDEDASTDKKKSVSCRKSKSKSKSRSTSSSFSIGRRSSKKSQDGETNIELYDPNVSRKSRGNNGSGSSSPSSSRSSRDREETSPRKESVSLDKTSSHGSENGSVYSS